MSEVWPWLAVGALGAYHGINPAMGWLFAVALGLQEQSRKALLQALLPIALGHLGAMAMAVALLGFAQLLVAPGTLRLVGAAGLIAFGCTKLLKPRSHSQWIGLRVRPREIAVWSFLMSTAHGAGLMLVPILVRMPSIAHAHAAGQHGLVTAGVGATAMAGGAGVAVHTLAMFIVMAAAALLVFERLGVGVLRQAWLNLDRVWAGVIVISGLFTLVGP